MIWVSEVVDELTCSKGGQMFDLSSTKPAPAPLPSIVDYSKFCTATSSPSLCFLKSHVTTEGREHTIVELIRDNRVSAIHGQARREECAIHGCSRGTQGEDVPTHAPHRPQSLCRNSSSIMSYNSRFIRAAPWEWAQFNLCLNLAWDRAII